MYEHECKQIFLNWFYFNLFICPVNKMTSLCLFQGNQAPENGVLVFGLFLDGASWDPNHECLNDSRPGDRFSKLPEIHFEPVQVKVSHNLD